MHRFALQTLTWGTVAAAVTSALWLASVDPGWSGWRADQVFKLPSQPTSAGNTRNAAPRGEKSRPPRPEPQRPAR